MSLSRLTDDYSAEELRWLKALDEYRRRNKRPFPTAIELLNILKGLGYRIEAGAGPPAHPPGGGNESGGSPAA